jgi:hypothetical protein
VLATFAVALLDAAAAVAHALGSPTKQSAFLPGLTGSELQQVRALVASTSRGGPTSSEAPAPDTMALDDVLDV